MVVRREVFMSGMVLLFENTFGVSCGLLSFSALYIALLAFYAYVNIHAIL